MKEKTILYDFVLILLVGLISISARVDAKLGAVAFTIALIILVISYNW